MNIKKKLIAIGIMALMALSSLTTVAEATRFDCKTLIGSFEWEVCYGQVKNQGNQDRLVEVCISVYDDKTNELVGNYYSRAIGPYGTAATVRNPNWSSKKYHFECWATVYNSTSIYSGTAWHTGIKYLD